MRVGRGGRGGGSVGSLGQVTHVLVPPGRWPRWVANFEDRHGTASLAVAGGALRGVAEDGAAFVARLPFSTAYDGEAEPGAFLDAVAPPAEWGVLLVRKGGFAVARMSGGAQVESKVGRRHVQGRTKAGGQSQQRFARRRDNQARQAFEAAADHASRLLADRGALPVVAGGDRDAVEQVLADSRLARLTVVGPWLPVPEPRRAELDAAVRDALSLVVEVDNAGS